MDINFRINYDIAIKGKHFIALKQIVWYKVDLQQS